MITLSLIVYVIISLLIARREYQDYRFNSYSGQSNPCYQNGKKSLKYGFLFVPVVGVSVYVAVMFVIGLLALVTKIINWIAINMP